MKASGKTKANRLFGYERMNDLPSKEFKLELLTSEGNEAGEPFCSRNLRWKMVLGSSAPSVPQAHAPFPITCTPLKGSDGQGPLLCRKT